MEHDSDWPVSMTVGIGKRVATIRSGKGMTVQALADRCAELGVPLGRVTLTKLEGGKRQAITPAELSVLAAALGVPPAELLYPVGYSERVEILPGRTVDALDAVRWFAGELSLSADGDNTTLRPATDPPNAVWLLSEHRDLVNRVREADGRAYLAWAEHQRAPDDLHAREVLMFRRGAVDELRKTAGKSLRRIRAQMREKGMILPGLPVVLSDVDEGCEQ